MRPNAQTTLRAQRGRDLEHASRRRAAPERRRGRRRPCGPRRGPGARGRRPADRRVGQRGGRSLGVLRQVVEQVAREQRGVDVGRRRPGGRRRCARARAGRRAPAASISSPVTSRDDARAGQEHGRVLGHDHEVGQRRRVGAAARRGAADDRDLRHDAGQRDVLAEDLARSPASAARSLLHARAGRLDEADHRHARALGQLEHARRSSRACASPSEPPAKAASCA